MASVALASPTPSVVDSLTVSAPVSGRGVAGMASASTSAAWFTNTRSRI